MPPDRLHCLVPRRPPCRILPCTAPWCRRKRKKCKGRAENAPKNPCVTLSFLSTEITGGFTGCTVGMYASANGTASTNYAAFYWFAYQQVRNRLR